MVARLDDLRPLLEQVFRQRREEVVACEQIVEISRSGAKAKHARVLVLSGPFAAAAAASSSAGAVLSIVRKEGIRAVKIRQAFSVARLVDVGLDGSFGASFNFGSSGMISVAFESHIQREMFVAAVRKLQRDALPAAPAAFGVYALLTDEIGAAADADAAARAKILRHARRRALSAEDGRLLLRFLGAHSFDDIRTVEQSLATCQKRAELLSAHFLVSSAEAWRDVRANVVSLVAEVDDLEARIAPFSRHVLARRAQLEHLERAGNTLLRKQGNLGRLQERLSAFSAQLSLPPGAMQLLRQLRNARGASLVDLLSSGTETARLLAETMRHMESLLRDKRLTREYPIAAVSERCTFFVEQRRMAAARAREFALHMIAQREAQYLADRSRLSGSGRIVWRPHTELYADLRGVADLLTALAHIDAAGACAVLRRYRVAMQRVYAVEMRHFFKVLRAQVRRVGPRGPFLIGVHDSPDDALANFMESTTTAGASPRRAGPGSSALPSPCTSVSFGLTPRGHRSGASFVSARRESASPLEIDLPPPCEESQRLYSKDAVRAVPAGAQSVVSALSAASDAKVGGELLPDMGFAMALETVAAAVVREEDVLRQCFGLAATSSSTHPFGSRESADSGEGEGERTQFPGGESSPAELVEESLFELFAGDRLVEFENIRGTLYKNRGSVRGDSTLSVKDISSVGFTFESIQECYLTRQLVKFVEYCASHCDRLYAVPMIVMVRAYCRDGTRTAGSSFLMSIISVLERTVAATLARSVAEQTASIVRCRKRYMLRPIGLLYCFTKLPAFVARMEAMHNAMPFTVRDRTEYANITQSLVDQSFDALNVITNLTASSAGSGESGTYKGKDKNKKKNVIETFSAAVCKTATRLLDGVGDNSAKRGFIQQYRHHAFFCASYASLMADGRQCYARDLLSDRNESCCALRDRYEELYLTRVLLVRNFPEFGSFVVTAEDLAQVHTREELRHHNALSFDAVEHVLRKMPSEVRAGIASASARLKKHFLLDVADKHGEESFHCTLVQRTWQHFAALLLQKVDFITGMLQWSMYSGLKMPISRREVAALLETA